jgi:hypothetical protein
VGGGAWVGRVREWTRVVHACSLMPMPLRTMRNDPSLAAPEHVTSEPCPWRSRSTTTKSTIGPMLAHLCSGGGGTTTGREHRATAARAYAAAVDRRSRTSISLSKYAVKSRHVKSRHVKSSQAHLDLVEQVAVKSRHVKSRHVKSSQAHLDLVEEVAVLVGGVGELHELRGKRAGGAERLSFG